MAEKTIMETLRERSAAFVLDPIGTEAEQVAFAAKATAAVLGGIKSEEWREFMILNAVNNKQLRRLHGLDGFSAEEWGRQALVYIAGDPNCSIDSGARTDVHLTPEMAEILDDEGEDPDFNEIDDGFPNNASTLEELFG